MNERAATAEEVAPSPSAFGGWAAWPARDRAGVVAFAAFLVVAVPVLVLSRAGDPWFMGDDWGLLQERSLARPSDWWRPQNGHWSTVPVVVYQTLLHVVGLHHFLVFRTVVVLTHLTVVALIWVLVRRLGHSVWYSSAVVVPLVLLGSMPTNLLSPIQMSQTGSVAFGLAFLLLVDHDGRLQRRDAVGVAMGLLSLASSGMGPVMVITVAVAVLLRRGWRRALALAGPPALVFVVWQQLTGAAGADSAVYDLGVTARWVREGLTATFSTPTRSTVAAQLLALGVMAGLVLLVRRDGLRTFRGRHAVVPALVVGAVVNFAAVSTQRSFMGAAYARTDRYVYVSLVLLLPVVAVALASFRPVWGPLPFVLLLPLLLAVPANAADLRHPPAFTFSVPRWLFLGAVEDPLAREVDPTVMLAPGAVTGRNVTIGWLLEQQRLGRLPASPVLTADQRAEVQLRLSLSRRALASVPSDCTEHRGSVDLDLQLGDRVRVDRAVTVQRLVDGAAVGPQVAYQVDPFLSAAADLVAEVPRIAVRLSVPGDGTFTTCR